MNTATSIYLDLVRFLAAFTVFIVHANFERFTGEGIPFLWRFSHLGNDAVMVFFVLSGFVIAYVANTKEKTLDAYFISRFARLYSVVLPALFITIILDYFGTRIAFDLYDGWWYQNDQPIYRVISNLFFANEFWFTSTRPFSNGPFWSIGYEFWYYVLFAFAFYIEKPIKYLLIFTVCILIGPKILLLLPVWLMGVFAYNFSCKKTIQESTGWILFTSSIVGFLVYRNNDGHELVLEATKHLLGHKLFESLSWSKFFLSSYIVGVFITLNFISFPSISHHFNKPLILIKKPVTYLASFTFALYLLHYPLLQFFSALTYDPQTRETLPFIVVIATLISIFLLGEITEKQKTNYKKFFILIWSKVNNN